MTNYGESAGRQPSTRRQKLYGYLKAANDVRQSYQSQLQQRLQSDGEDEHTPGDFPDVEIVRRGDEELLLFPSYARKHVKKHSSSLNSNMQPLPGSEESIEKPRSNGDADYWRREWEKYEDDNAIVDVDVRGWIYSPQRGALSRKNRLLVAVARRLSGIPTPNSSPDYGATPGEYSSHRERLDERTMKHEEEAALKEAESIARHGQREADAAWRGRFSTDPDRAYDSDSPEASRSSSPRHSLKTGTAHSLADTEPVSGDESLGLQALTKRQSWQQPWNMSKEELVAANEHLMTRLKPFMSTPLANTSITIFFFNDERSQSKTVTTNESGHFSLRAGLNFVPKSVRVLASENLSATEDVIVTEARGISLVSDIDDTIKHSAIASGAREIFKNTFIRELNDLTINGVKEWYATLAKMGVKMHYVSNSPWQLYPLLRKYFSMAGLPPGSFHLKQYSGMLQGIFEPAAERKRGSLDRIMHDFPERKFILVGDSGEADLEVYTDVVLAHPGRILGIFIRDVTTPEQKKFFDQAMSNVPPDTRISARTGEHLSPQERTPDVSKTRPSLPPRSKTVAAAEPAVMEQPDLIDFSDKPEMASLNKQESSASTEHLPSLSAGQPVTKPQPPNRPSKPSSLRSMSTSSQQTPANENASPEDISKEAKRARPPKPRRPSASVDTSNLGSQSRSSRPPFSSKRQDQSHSEYSKTNPDHPPAPAPRRGIRRTATSSTMSSTNSTKEEEGYVASARRQISTVYNALPPMRSTSPSRSSGERSQPPPMHRGITSYPAAAARWATGATGGDPTAGGDGGAPGAPYDKKLETWRRRWARAEEITKNKGILLRTWRIGTDVMDDCVDLVVRAAKEMEMKAGRNG